MERTIGWTQALVMAKVAVVPAFGCPLYNAAVAQWQITTTEDQSATFIELFFDLVFVYAVTQTVSLLHEDFSWAGLGHAVVVFWLVWWAWMQYTWALNSADTTHPGVDAVMLGATAIAFLRAVSIPDAFGEAGGWFAATYIAVRVVGLGLYARVAWDDVAKRSAVRERGAVGAQAGKDVLNVVDGEHDATDAQRVHRCVFWLSPDRRWRVELVQLNPPLAVRGPHQCNVATDSVEPDEAVHRLSLDGRLALKLQTKFSEERDRSLEVVDNDEDVVHPQKCHGSSPSSSRGLTWPLVYLERSQRRILDSRK